MTVLVFLSESVSVGLWDNKDIDTFNEKYVSDVVRENETVWLEAGVLLFDVVKVQVLVLDGLLSVADKSCDREVVSKPGLVESLTEPLCV